MPIPTYRDIDFNFGKVNNQFINIKQNENDIIQSIKNVVLSSNGEVPFTTDRVGLLEQKFNTIGFYDKSRLESDILNKINFIDPRVEITEVDVNQDNSTLAVTVKFRIKDTTEIRTIIITTGT